MKPLIFEKCPEFLSKPPTKLKYLVTELLPASTMVLLHGDPRTRKSYSALELAISCSTGCAPFGIERFQSTKSRVLYLSQEDPEHVVNERVRGILDDKELDPPESFSTGIHLGISLDNPKNCDELWSRIKAEAFDMVIFDPIRRFTVCADLGPAQVTPITTFFRKFCVELNACMVIVHHDTKPFFKDGIDARKNGYKASGGDWFASCECPIYFESNGNEWTHVIPDSYKLSESPLPFDVSVIKDPETGRARLLGRDSLDPNRERRIIKFLHQESNQSENSIASNCHIKREDLKSLLLECQNKGILTNQEGPRNSVLWSLVRGNSFKM